MTHSAPESTTGSVQNPSPRSSKIRDLAPHPSWRPEWPPGSAILGKTAAGKWIVLPPEMRKLGLHILGLPNQGKSKLMEAMARLDVLSLCGARRSVIFVDPHGSSYTALLNWFVTHGIDRLVPLRLVDLSDPDYIFKLNPSKRRPGVDPAVPAAATRDAILKGSWGKSGLDPAALPQLTETLDITFTTIAEFGASFADAAALLELDDSSGFRRYAAQNSENPLVRSFWRTVEINHPREREALIGGARRRLNRFLLPRRARQLFDEPEDVIDWRAVMDGEVVLINLAYDESGVVSEDQATTVGTLIMNDIFLACRGRSEQDIPTYLYWDEVHRFLTEAAARLFTEARKFRLHAIFAHQIFQQLDEVSPFIKGAITSCRNKIFFGGLPPEDAKWAAEFAYRGQLDLQKIKHVFDKPTVVGHAPIWLASESESRGTAETRGTTSTHGGSTAYHESSTIGHSETTGDSYSTSELHIDSESGASAEGTSSSASQAGSRSSAQEYDQAGMWVGGPTVTTGSANTAGSGSNASSSAGWGSADTTGSSETRSHGSSESFSETSGITETSSWSEGESATRTESRSRARGRAQALKPVLKTMPTQGYTLEELIYEAATEIAALEQGECVVKIGKRPAAKVRTLRIRDGWARPQHIRRVKARLAAEVPYVQPSAQAAITSNPAPMLLPPIADPEPIAVDTAPDASRLPVSPPLKDEGWG